MDELNISLRSVEFILDSRKLNQLHKCYFLEKKRAFDLAGYVSSNHVFFFEIQMK